MYHMETEIYLINMYADLTAINENAKMIAVGH